MPQHHAIHAITKKQVACLPQTRSTGAYATARSAVFGLLFSRLAVAIVARRRRASSGFGGLSLPSRVPLDALRGNRVAAAACAGLRKPRKIVPVFRVRTVSFMALQNLSFYGLTKPRKIISSLARIGRTVTALRYAQLRYANRLFPRVRGASHLSYSTAQNRAGCPDV